MIIEGDCLEVMREMPSNSVSAIVTDPPYGLSFLNKSWDKVLPPVEIWEEALRVLKPGGIARVFGGTRTFHRLACSLEDAGFQMRDCINWMYGSGFPKSHDIGKGIDRKRYDRAQILEVTRWIKSSRDASGASNRDIDEAFGTHGMAGHWTSSKSQPAVPNIDQIPKLLAVFSMTLDDVPEDIRHLLWTLNGRKGQPGENWAKREKVGEIVMTDSSARRIAVSTSAHDCIVRNRAVDITAPATDAAKQWDGWGTALKPAWEPILVCMKPLDGTFANNAQTHGVAGINVEGCRIQVSSGDPNQRKPSAGNRGANSVFGVGGHSGNLKSQGRWPSNVILDEESGAMLDKQTGTLKSGKLTAENQVNGGFSGTKNAYGTASTGGTLNFESNSGGASRFFYCAKANKKDRGEDNNHPTVKPRELMRHLVRLVTMPEGTKILDPFAGSGSTGVACNLEGVEFIGIEMDPDFAQIARERTND